MSEEKTCIRCFEKIKSKEVDGITQYNAIEISKFNNLGLDEGMLCENCQGALTVVSGSGIKAHGFMTNHPRLSCLRCGHSWEAESAKLPKTCPNKKCRSPYWNKPRTKGVIASVERK